MSTLPNTIGCGGCDLNIKNLDVDSLEANLVSTEYLTLKGEVFPDEYKFSAINGETLTIDGKPGTVHIINRDLTQCDSNADGLPGTEPNIGYDRFRVYGESQFGSQVKVIYTQNPGNFLDEFGIVLEMSNPHGYPKHSSLGYRGPVYTTTQLGHDFEDNYGGSLTTFAYYGHGDYRNRLTMDVNANVGSSTPAFTLLMPTVSLTSVPNVMPVRIYNDNYVGRIVNMNFWGNAQRPIAGMTLTISGCTPSSLNITNAIITSVTNKSGVDASVISCCDVYFTTPIADVLQSSVVGEVRIGPKISAANGVVTVEFPNGPKPIKGQAINVSALPDTLNASRAVITSVTLNDVTSYTSTSTLTYSIADPSPSIVMTSLVSCELAPQNVGTSGQLGNLCRVGIHTDNPRSALDVKGDTTIRDVWTNRPIMELLSTGETQSIVYFKDTTRSTNYPNMIVDCFNGDIKMVNPETNGTFAYFDTTTQQCTFSKYYSDLPVKERNFFVIDAGLGEVSAKILPTTSQDFFFLKSDGTRTGIGTNARQALADYGATYQTFITNNVACTYGGFNVVADHTKNNPTTFFVGLSGSMNLFRCNWDQTKTPYDGYVCIGTSTRSGSSILTVQGDVNIAGNLNSNTAKVNYKGLTALNGAVTLGTEQKFLKWFNVVWSVNSNQSQTYDQVTYSGNAFATSSFSSTYTNNKAFTTTASQQWRSNLGYNKTTGVYAGSASIIVSNVATSGERVEAQVKLGANFVTLAPQSITFTAPLCDHDSGSTKVKTVVIWAWSPITSAYTKLYEGVTASTGSETITITPSTSGSIASAWTTAYEHYGILCKDLWILSPPTNAACAAISQFYVTGARLLPPVAQHYIPNALEVGVDTSSPQTMTTSTFKVNGTSVFTGSSTFNQGVQVTTPIVMSASHIGYTYQVDLASSLAQINTSTWAAPTDILTTTVNPGIWIINAVIMIRNYSTTTPAGMYKYQCYLVDSNSVSYGGSVGGNSTVATSIANSASAEACLQIKCGTTIPVINVSTTLKLKLGIQLITVSPYGGPVYVSTGDTSFDNGKNTYIRLTRIG